MSFDLLAAVLLSAVLLSVMLESALLSDFFETELADSLAFEASELLFTVALSAEAADVTAVLLPAVPDALPLLVTAALSPQPKENAATEHNSTKLHKSFILRLELVFNISMASLKFSIFYWWAIVNVNLNCWQEC